MGITFHYRSRHYFYIARILCTQTCIMHCILHSYLHKSVALSLKRKTSTMYFLFVCVYVRCTLYGIKWWKCLRNKPITSKWNEKIAEIQQKMYEKIFTQWISFWKEQVVREFLMLPLITYVMSMLHSKKLNFISCSFSFASLPKKKISNVLSIISSFERWIWMNLNWGVRQQKSKHYMGFFIREY